MTERAFGAGVEGAPAARAAAGAARLRRPAIRGGRLGATGGRP